MDQFVLKCAACDSNLGFFRSPPSRCSRAAAPPHLPPFTRTLAWMPARGLRSNSPMARPSPGKANRSTLKARSHVVSFARAAPPAKRHAPPEPRAGEAPSSQPARTVRSARPRGPRPFRSRRRPHRVRRPPTRASIRAASFSAATFAANAAPARVTRPLPSAHSIVTPKPRRSRMLGQQRETPRPFTTCAKNR